MHHDPVSYVSALLIARQQMLFEECNSNEVKSLWWAATLSSVDRLCFKWETSEWCCFVHGGLQRLMCCVGFLWLRLRETSFLSCVGLPSMEKMTPLARKKGRRCTQRITRCSASRWVSSADFKRRSCLQRFSIILELEFLLWTQNHVNPAMDFTLTPPGMLALDNMLYLAKVHQDTYIRVSFSLRRDFAHPHRREEANNS